LQINSLGNSQARTEYKELLVAYLQQHIEQLDDDSKRRLSTNPLRILDSKDTNTQKVVANAPKLIDHLDEESKQHFTQLCERLDTLGIQYTINPSLVRGLDYYNRTVFEWVTTLLGAQGTICAGGRYDGLVEQLGAKATPAVGFAMGIERLVLLVETTLVEPMLNEADVYVTAMGENAANEAMVLVENIRDQFSFLKVQLHCGGGNFKKQLKKADASGAKIAIVIGEQESLNKVFGVKWLRKDVTQTQASESDLMDILADLN
jgi:histidyl-tRNA synthetase